MLISDFTEEYFFLSNFYPSGMFVPEMGWVDTLEHAYQACKTLDLAERASVASARTAGVSKRMGQKATLRPDWERIKDLVMRDLLAIKFSLDSELSTKLMATGNARLIEGNTWGDRYWGAENVGAPLGFVGQNKLGKLLMLRRDELQGTSLWR